MSFLRRKKDEEYEDEYEDELEEDVRPVRSSRTRIRDLNPKNKRKRKEPPKPWGKKERYIVLSLLLITAAVSAILAVSARDFKLPGLPKINLGRDLNLGSLFKEETITIGKGTPEQKQRGEKIIAEFENKTKDFSGSYALYVIDLSNGYSFGVDEEQKMQAASLIKLPVMLFASGRVDEAKIEAMGKRSDNAVFSQLVSEFGEAELESYIVGKLGMVNTSISENETTPKEMGDLFKKIYDGKNEAILGFLTDTIYEEWLTKGVPPGVRVAHKYGREVHVVNDAGVVYAENPYVVVIMTQGIVEKEADGVFPGLSKLVYDGLNK